MKTSNATLFPRSTYLAIGVLAASALLIVSIIPLMRHNAIYTLEGSIPDDRDRDGIATLYDKVYNPEITRIPIPKKK